MSNSGTHLKGYVEYIRNTARVPLPVELFDDDWEPIGPLVRAEMIAAGLVECTPSGLTLTERGAAMMPRRAP